MRSTAIAFVTIGSIAGLGAAGAAADIFVINVSLTPEQETTPPTLGGATPSGTATVTVNTETNFVEIFGTYAGMTSPVSGSHLHGLTSFGDPSPVIIILSNDGGTSGTFSGSATLSASLFNGLLNDLTYINVHTVNNGPGEIRGNVIVPTPGAIALAGMVGLASLRRRR